MLDNFLNYIRSNHLFDENDNILVSVSGGIDSMVMLELFSSSPYKFTIVHCNFQLRGKESDEDELFIKALGKKNGIEVLVSTFNTEEYARNNRISIQMAARQLRYAWFESLIVEKGYSYYASAHHLDDQIETFFINLTRGTGISGLHGIKPKHGKLVRPLLWAHRSEIESFALQNKINFREDSSNKKSDYLRNDIRLNLVPVIKKIKPEFADVMAQNFQRFNQAERIYKNEIEARKLEAIHEEQEEIKISIIQLKKLEPLETYLYEFLIPYGFSFANTIDILNSFTSESGKKFYSCSHVLIRDRDFLLIRKKETNLDSLQKEYVIDRSSELIFKPIHLKMKTFQMNTDFEFSENRLIVSLDLDKLVFPLLLRKWKKGDRFYPLGMDNRKLVSDFYTDNKFSLFEKEDTWLLFSNNKLVWIIGHRIDNRFKVDNSTKSIFQIEFIKTHYCKEC